MPLSLSRVLHPLFTVAVVTALTACASTKGQAPGTDQPADAVVTSEAKPGGFSQPEAGQGITEVDTNGDQRTDLVKIWSGPPNAVPEKEDGTPGVDLLRKEVDLNHDGKVDVWSWYGSEGEVSRQAYDLDFDGRIDVIAHYEKGVVIRKEVFQSYREEPDTFKFYEKGQLQRVERDRNGDGRIDTWEYWEGEQIDRVGEDLDGDGNVDKWVKPKQKS